MAKKSAAEKIQDMLGNLDELIEQAHKDTVKEAREGLAAELVRDSKTDRDNFELLLDGFDDASLQLDVDFKSFRAGMRFAAFLIANPNYEY